MDLTNLARILFTVFCFVAFIVILIGAFEKNRRGVMTMRPTLSSMATRKSSKGSTPSTERRNE
ncbi:hypothetical protein ACFSQE_05550 [Vogesella fluminis]|uniref:hypothetical protein n=1 Tax=Vogesella fluminis TaxID=1069161 RepID=UPI0036286157